MKQMKMRTVRTAGLVGGLATGALLLAGTAAQAADTVENTTDDLVMATPEALGGLPVSPDAATGLAGGLTGGVTEKAPGLDAVPVDAVPVDSVPVLGAVAPVGAVTEAKGGQVDQVPTAPLGSLPAGDLLSGLGGGLPVPLPF